MLLDVTWREVAEELFSPSSLLQIAFIAYLIIGVGVAGFILFRGMKIRRPPTGGLLWEKKDHARNVLFLFQGIVLLSPIIFFIYIAFWPLVLLWLWAYQEDDES
jgi:hypothetical protein